MFHSSPRIDSRLAEEVTQVERQVAGYLVLSAYLCTAPVAYFRATCEVLQARRLNAIEEYVLQAAIELSPAATPIELADALGVDQRFIHEVTTNFTEKLAVLKIGSGNTLTATEKGKDFYKRRQIPKPPRLETVDLAYFTPYYAFIALPSGYKEDSLEIAPSLPGVPPLEQVTLKRVMEQINKNTVSAATQSIGKPIHHPEAGQTLGTMRSVELASQGLWNWAVLVVWDALEKEVFIRLSNISYPAVPPKEIRGFALDEWLEDANVRLEDLLQLEDADYQAFADLAPANRAQLSDTQSRAGMVARLVESELREIRNPTGGILNRSLYEGGIAEILRQQDVPNALRNALKQAKGRVLIVVPRLTDQWLDEQLINQFRELAARRVITVIGWGKASQYSDEDSTPSLQLLSKLGEIKSPEGLPAVLVQWLGSQYSKDVIIDNRLHLCATANWVQHHDDDLPGVETVYKVTIHEQVRQAAETIEQLFFEHTASSWETRIQSPVKETDIELLSGYLAVLAAVGRFGEAAARAVSLTQVPHRHFQPLVRLCQAATESIYGVNAETRTDLLQIIGDEWQRPNNITKISEFLDEDERSSFAKILLLLLEQLLDQDEIALRTTLDGYQDVWSGVGVFKEGQTIDGLIDQIRKQKKVSGTGRLNQAK